MLFTLPYKAPMHMATSLSWYVSASSRNFWSSGLPQLIDYALVSYPWELFGAACPQKCSIKDNVLTQFVDINVQFTVIIVFSVIMDSVLSYYG